jgi:adenine deaminase
MKKIFAMLIAVATLLGATGKNSGIETADLVLRHGKIYTMDASRSWAESVAVAKGRIVYVGDDAGIAHRQKYTNC